MKRLLLSLMVAICSVMLISSHADARPKKRIRHHVNPPVTSDCGFFFCPDVTPQASTRRGYGRQVNSAGIEVDWHGIKASKPESRHLIEFQRHLIGNVDIVKKKKYE